MRKIYVWLAALMAVMMAGNAIGQTSSFVYGDFKYRITGKNTVAVSADDMKMSGNVAIPQSVVFSDTTYTVTEVDRRGFADCGGIMSIVLPAKITRIDAEAFMNCRNLNTINIPYGVKEIKESTFEGCRYLVGITVPDGVRSIGDGAFRDCERLIRFLVPDGCKSLGNEVFAGCAKLQVVTIPEGMEQIGDNVFRGCTELVRFAVESGNKFFFCDNDALIWDSGKKTVFIKYPAKKRDAMYVLPGNVQEIGGFAFEGVEELLVIKVNNGCHTVQNYAFMCCNKLEKIEYPQSLRLIGEAAAFGCPMLTECDTPGGIMYIEEP